MPAGIQTFTGSGALWLDLTERIGTEYTSILTGTNPGSTQLPTDRGFPYIYTVCDGARYVYNPQRDYLEQWQTPSVIFDPNTFLLSWYWEDAQFRKASMRIIIGFF